MTSEHADVLRYASRTDMPAERMAWSTSGTGDSELLARRIGRLLSEAADVACGRPRPVESASLAEGVASGKRFMQIFQLLLASSDELSSMVAQGNFRALDVGTGVGGVLAHLLSDNGSATAVGLDIDSAALAVGHSLLTDRGLGSRAEFRFASVCELADEEEYDFAWVPLHMLAAPDAERALARVAKALRPGGLQITAVGCASSGDASDELGRAVARWRLSIRGLCAWDDVQAIARLGEVGLVPTHRLRPSPLEPPVLLARKPLT